MSDSITVAVSSLGPCALELRHAASVSAPSKSPSTPTSSFKTSDSKSKMTPNIHIVTGNPACEANEENITIEVVDIDMIGVDMIIEDLDTTFPLDDIPDDDSKDKFIENYEQLSVSITDFPGVELSTAPEDQKSAASLVLKNDYRNSFPMQDSSCTIILQFPIDRLLEKYRISKIETAWLSEPFLSIAALPFEGPALDQTIAPFSIASPKFKQSLTANQVYGFDEGVSDTCQMLFDAGQENTYSVAINNSFFTSNLQLPQKFSRVSSRLRKPRFLFAKQKLLARKRKTEKSVEKKPHVNSLKLNVMMKQLEQAKANILESCGNNSIQTDSVDYSQVGQDIQFIKTNTGKYCIEKVFFTIYAMDCSYSINCVMPTGCIMDHETLMHSAVEPAVLLSIIGCTSNAMCKPIPSIYPSKRIIISRIPKMLL
ncbi:hypothetical protein BDR26DRAFT_360374 [Obelidium mucronatum]|nr:hypothetical protein BDR26DRAFT_360374 [Obelidium mucronatum]